jgi:hypothetical protein
MSVDAQLIHLLVRCARFQLVSFHWSLFPKSKCRLRGTQGGRQRFRKTPTTALCASAGSNRESTENDVPPLLISRDSLTDLVSRTDDANAVQQSRRGERVMEFLAKETCDRSALPACLRYSPFVLPICYAQNLGGQPATGQAVQGQTAAQPEGTVLNLRTGSAT